MPSTTDFMVHGDEFAQGYMMEGELPFARLLFRLSIRKLPGGEQLAPEDRAELYLAVAHGLADGIIRYLWRNRVEAAGRPVHAALAERVRRARERGYMWIRVRALPERILALFLGTPGIDVFRPAGANAAVAVGYQHPIDLACASSVFPADTFHVFWPNDRVDVLPGPLALSDIARSDEASTSSSTSRAIRPQHGGGPPEPIGVELRARGRDGPAAPRGRDADSASSTARASSASCSRCRRCRCAAIACRSPTAASSSSAARTSTSSRSASCSAS